VDGGAEILRHVVFMGYMCGIYILDLSLALTSCIVQLSRTHEPTATNRTGGPSISNPYRSQHRLSEAPSTSLHLVRLLLGELVLILSTLDFRGLLGVEPPCTRNQRMARTLPSQRSVRLNIRLLSCETHKRTATTQTSTMRPLMFQWWKVDSGSSKRK
jgi:hypothetical protein